MSLTKSIVKVVNGQLPVGWERKLFLKPTDNGVGIITILSESPYSPTAEKKAEIQLKHPNTFKTLHLEKFLKVQIDLGGAGTIERTMMLSQYANAIKAAGGSPVAADDTLKQGYKVRIENGELTVLLTKSQKAEKVEELEEELAE